jgi:hypothetical protein
VRLQVTAVDADPATDCLTWIGSLRTNGVELTYDSVPYVNDPNGGHAKVHVKVRY